MSVFDASARRWCLAGAGLLLIAGCSGPKVSSERNSAVPIPSGATVQFRGQASTGAGQVKNDSIHRFIQEAIVAQLTAKGYTVVDTSTAANFTMRYFLAVVTTEGYSQSAGGVGGPKITGYGSGYGRTQETHPTDLPPLDQFKNASFEVGLIDEKAGRTAWRGVLEAEPKNEAPSEQRINSLVAKVMKTLPQVP